MVDAYAVFIAMPVTVLVDIDSLAHGAILRTTKTVRLTSDHALFIALPTSYVFFLIQVRIY